MPSSKPTRRLLDIVDNIDRIMRYTAGMDATTFADDEKTIDAVERCLGRVTEAAIKLGEVAEKLAPGPPWQDVRGFGNVLRHDYDNLDLDAVWRIVEHDLPTLLAACRLALDRLGPAGH